MTTCPSCAAPGQPDGARFCFSCGSPLGAPTCPSCRAEVVPGARFCGSCGAPLAATVPAPAYGAPVQPPTAARVAARRITSVLFGDLVGFTALSETRDTEDVRELLSRYFEECRQIVARYGGTIEKFIGDAVMAVWGVPVAHEDDAERAVRAGLELVNTVTAMGHDLGIPDLAMRVGIVTGEVAVTLGAQQQGMVAGDAVNTASRIQSVAGPGQVWVDETTRLLTSSAITYVDVGSHPMKGKADPVPLWAVRAVVAAVGGAQRADGLEAPLVGRDREMRLLKELFHGTEDSHRPALLVVDGEAGSGKSRLGWEFEKYVDGLSTAVRWHNGRCLAYGEGVAFYALAEAVRGRCLTALEDRDAEGAALGRQEDDQAALLAAGLDRYVPDDTERTWIEPRMAALLGIGEGTFPREDLFAAWTTFLHRVSEDEVPLVLLIDDAQHADDGLLMFLEHVLSVGTFPIFIVLLTRPGLLEEHPGLATNRRATVLHLEPLSARDMGTLLDGLVVGLPADVRESLVQRAEGMPLFAVETVRSLIDRDLVIPRGGQYVLADPASLDLDSIGAPASLQALIAARLDTLPAEQRRVVDQASVVGSSFSREAIAALCPEIADLDAVLAGLVRLQLLRQESSRFSSEAGQYQFVQSAVRQVAYGTLSRRDRKATHLAVVRQLESAGEDTADVAAVIAQHYLEALDAVPEDADVPELTAAAIAQLRRAARRASALGSPAEAAGHLEEALTRSTDPGERITLDLEYAAALQRAGDYAGAIRHAEAARTAFEAAGDVKGAARAATVKAEALVAGARDNEAAYEVARPYYEALRDRDDAREEVLRLLLPMSSSRMRIGSGFRELVDHQLQLAELMGEAGVIADSYIGLALHYSNNGTQSLSRILFESAAGIARRERDIITLVRAQVNLNATWNQEDAATAVEHGREGLVAARTLGFQYWLGNAALNLSLGLYLLGEWDEALAVVDEGMIARMDLPILEFVRGRILTARGQQWEPLPDIWVDGETDDTGLLAWQSTIQAVALHEQGNDERVPALAVQAVDRCYAASELFDDFTIIWGAAADVLLACDDRAGLDRIVEVVTDHAATNPPRGLRAHRHRLRGLLLQRDGADPALVEEALRAALDEYDAWHAVPLAARARAELGGWLATQGRHDEAAPLLDEARTTYAALGMPGLEPAGLRPPAPPG